MALREINYYQSRCGLLSGSSYDEFLAAARKIHKATVAKSRRTPYVNCKYKNFRTNKVFLNVFWVHIFQKGKRERSERLRLYACAVDLLKNTRISPEIVDKRNDIFYRFFGATRTGEKFCVQVKEDKGTGRKYLMSVFPWRSK